jgi:hypothetical protein
MKQKPTPKTVVVIRAVENFEEHYYRKPDNQKYQKLHTERIPEWLFEEYTHHRNAMLDLRRRIRHYFKPLNDKPMTISKYHQDEENTIE